ncbi:RNA polymerase sigma factor SigZ [Novipirellula rosea]|uniref:RNA polymerase sigma factor SigZ n=1 Tax=Novipirellula rosea TaxID=1031540 RepID=A0ABP8M8D9_9BACT
MSDTQQVWDDFGTALRAFIRRRVNDDHVADDLLQDVFVRIHDKLGSLTDEDRLAAWLYQIARNVVTDHYRRRFEFTFDEAEIQVDQVTDDQNLNEQVGQWLVNRIAELPEDYREAVTLSELKGVRQTEVAERIGLSVSGAKSRIQRGRKMLKDILLQCCHFEFDKRGNVIDYQVRADCIACCESASGEYS